MRRCILPAFLLLALLPITGCTAGSKAVVSYNASNDQTTYETGPFTVANRTGESYGSSKNIDMRVVARCRGRNCSPDFAKLMFIGSGSQNLTLSGVDGKITADGTVIDWSTSEAAMRDNLSRDEVIDAIGTFAVVEIRFDQLRKIATASSLSGSIGGIQLQLGSNVQSGLQAMLQKIEQGTGAASSSTGR